MLAKQAANTPIAPVEEKKEVVAVMAETKPADKPPEECPHCKGKDAELATIRATLQTAHQGREAAEAKLTELSSADRLPSVRDFIAHCEGSDCDHKSQWQAVKTELIQSTLDNLPLEVVKSKAEALGMGIMPKHFILRDVERILKG